MNLHQWKRLRIRDRWLRCDGCGKRGRRKGMWRSEIIPGSGLTPRKPYCDGNCHFMRF